MTLVRFWRLCLREYKLFFTDKTLVAVVMLSPIAYTILFGFIYSAMRVTQIPTWIIDHDRSAISRNITEAYANHELLKITRTNGTLAEFKKESLNGKVFACIIIPKYFEKNLKKNKPARIMTYIEGSNLLITNSISKAAAEIAGTYAAAAEIKRFNVQGAPGKIAAIDANPIVSSVRILNNPTMNYKDFLVPGMIGAIIQQVTLLAVALAFSREREDNLLKDVHKISSSALELILAKASAYGFLNITMGGVALFITFKVFNIKFAGNPLLLLALLTAFVLCLVAMGIIVSVAVDDKLAATQALMVIAVPSFMISGYTWPQFAMNKYLIALSNFMPLTHFVIPLRDIALMSAGYESIRHHMVWMWILLIVFYAIAYPMVAFKLKKAAPENLRKTEGAAI